MGPNLACVLLLVCFCAAEVSIEGNIPDVNTEESIPEVSRGKRNPQVSAEESTNEVVVEESMPEANTQESNPEGNAKESTPEVVVEESMPEVNTQESNPEENAKESTPEVVVEESMPEVNTQESNPEENAKESTSEVTVDGSTLKVSVESTSHIKEEEGNSIKVNVNESTSEIRIQESAPTFTVEDSISEVRMEESSPEVSVEENTTEVNMEENASEVPEKEIEPVVSTIEGKLRGTTLRTHKGKIIYAFLGIPYATPPTGQLRFMPPKPFRPWHGVRDAKKEGQSCPQLTYPERKYEGSEDCLYLNVYTSKMPNISSLETALQDVVVVLHDGGFSHGSGDIAMYGPDYLLDHDVVMVTCNYRLGALGFLATGDESASGNYGLKDQVDVMRWVRRNIHNFSGDPNSVTLFGAGAGAASVHYHMLSVLSHKLFHRAISQSGTALSPWAHVRATTARKRAFKLGKLLGCKKKELEETEQLIKCIGRKPVKDLVEESAKILEYSTRFTHPFVPVEDEVVLKNKKPLLHDRPINIMKKPVPALWEIPWLVGVTSHEGLPQSLQVMLYQDLKEGLDKEPAKNILKYLGFDVQAEKAQEVGQKIWEFYLHNDTISYGTNLVKLAEMTTDFNYYYGLQKSVETHIAASDTPIFVYHFSYSRRDPRFSLGVPHGDDTLYLFPNIIAGTKLVIDKEHFHIIERLLHIITNFVRNGDPTPQETPELNNILWPVIEPNNFKYVDISEKLTIKNNFFPERMAFWDSIFKMVEETPKVVKDEL